MTGEELVLRVVGKQVIAHGVVALDLAAPDGAQLPRWAAGAHVDLQCGAFLRQYSLCGDPDDLSTYRVAVRREEAGRGGSSFVHDVLGEGDTVMMAGPRNHFPLVEAKQYLFVAGGIGITPLLPMIAAVEADGSGWTLVYGGRDRASMPFAAELLARHGDRVSLQPQDEVGLLDLPALFGELEAGTAVYCCGPEGLLLAAEQIAADRNDVSLHVERFAPKVVEAAPNAAFEIEIAGSGEVYEVAAGRSVLEVLTAAGVPVLSSCTEGTCGTCETGVLAGSVEHRDSILSPGEQESNDVMFVCVSRSRDGGRLVLDL